MKLLDSLTHYDHRMLLWCMDLRFHKQLIQLARVVSKTGDGYLQVILPLGIYLLSTEHGSNFLSLVLLAFAIERPLYWVLKNSFKRNRPPDIIPCFKSIVEASDKFSFPSGHTAASFLLATLCYLYFGAIALPLFIWALFVGISRVLLGVHFPTDILAGSVLGMLIGINSFNYLFG